jgi:hypothetical protein
MSAWGSLFGIDRFFAPLSETDPIAQLVIDLLEVGDGWRHDQYWLWHPTGATMWIANQWYGFKLLIRPDGREEPNVGDGQQVSLTRPGRSALIRAVKKHLRDGHDARTVAAGRELARRVLVMYGEGQGA